MQQLYQRGLRPLIFRGFKADPEVVHNNMLAWLAWMSEDAQRGVMVHRPTRQVAQQMMESLCVVRSHRLTQTLWNTTFPNPLGLAAGFDKNGTAARAWPLLGFGFAEMGTVTYHAQPGNPKPRLFRLVEDSAALNRMGFNNAGAAALSKTLTQHWPQNDYSMPLGINLGKSKITPLEDAAQDYRQSFEQLKHQGSYFVVNVSSPNTPGLRSLQATEQLSPILDALLAINTDNKPILVKIAPDLAKEDIIEIVDLTQSAGLSGIIATNTTIRRDHLKTQTITATGKPVTEEPGGISGMPVRDRATDVIRLIYSHTQGTLPIIGVGGIFTAQDAWEKITAGATLLQTYTGWVYEGPTMVKSVLNGLLKYLDEHQIENISDAIGLDHH